MSSTSLSPKFAAHPGTPSVRTSFGPRLVIAAAIVMTGCGDSNGAESVLPAPSRQRFDEEVYPIMLRDCAFHACHGDPLRPFQVYGAGRRRIDTPGEITLIPHDPSTETEMSLSYERARSMLLHRGDPEQAPLLRKIRPGGAHEATDRWGRNVYTSVEESGYRTIHAWATSAPSPDLDDDGDESGETDSSDTRDPEDRR